ncbi:MAG: hypothetical protein GY796_16585 [Chloroflexi bacterium]|nr:hypothetical protein [Chloroflexota bacterium]
MSMKTYQISLLAVILLLIGCSSNAEPARIHLTPESTITQPPPTKSLPTSTRTPVPVKTEISCEPTSNPFPTPSGLADSFQYNPNIDINRVCTFTGQVSRGQIYKHQITQDLVFCLVPGGIIRDIPDEGWNIIISDTRPDSCDHSSKDYANFGSRVTPPFRGNLYFDVYGWHFRNAENTGENDGSVNAPQEERHLNFVFNRQDYETLWYAARCNRWAIDTDCAQATQTSTNTEIPRSSAKFTVTKLELGNLVPDSHAWIEYMEFKVDVYLPAE